MQTAEACMAVQHEPATRSTNFHLSLWPFWLAWLTRLRAVARLLRSTQCVRSILAAHVLEAPTHGMRERESARRSADLDAPEAPQLAFGCRSSEVLRPPPPPFQQLRAKRFSLRSSASALFFRAARCRTGPLVPASWRVPAIYRIYILHT